MFEDNHLKIARESAQIICRGILSAGIVMDNEIYFNGMSIRGDESTLTDKLRRLIKVTDENEYLIEDKETAEAVRFNLGRIKNAPGLFSNLTPALLSLRYGQTFRMILNYIRTPKTCGIALNFEYFIDQWIKTGNSDYIQKFLNCADSSLLFYRGFLKENGYSLSELSTGGLSEQIFLEEHNKKHLTPPKEHLLELLKEWEDQLGDFRTDLMFYDLD